jgi:hypothetical protein
VQGLDAAGVQSYQAHLIATFCKPPTDAASGRLQQEQADDDDDDEGAAEGGRGGRRWALEQLYATASLPAAGHQERLRAAKFLAAAAFFEVVAGKVRASPAGSNVLGWGCGCGCGGADVHSVGLGWWAVQG